MDIDPNLFGRFVTVTWQDTQAFVNADPADVCLAECKSLGVLISVDSDKLVLRSARYTGSDTGDYTAIVVGCIDNVEPAN